MAHKYADELQQISDYLQAGLELCKQIDQPEMAAVKMRLNNALKKEQAFVHSLLGSSKAATEDEVTHLQPMTHYFGQPLKVTQPEAVNIKDLIPSGDEKAKFKAEVEDYYKNFLDIPTEKLFNKSTLPGGDQVIRGVAKMAGYPEYDSAEIDQAYLVGVKAAIEQKNTESAALKEASKKLKDNTKK